MSAPRWCPPWAPAWLGNTRTWSRRTGTACRDGRCRDQMLFIWGCMPSWSESAARMRCSGVSKLHARREPCKTSPYPSVGALLATLLPVTRRQDSPVAAPEGVRGRPHGGARVETEHLAVLVPDEVRHGAHPLAAVHPHVGRPVQPAHPPASVITSVCESTSATVLRKAGHM